MKNYYKILGVPPTAGLDEIKIAYRRLAKKNHPDLNPGDKAAEERFKEIGEAYENLSDDGKRKQHDTALSGQSQKKQGTARPTGPVRAPVGKINVDDLMSGFDQYFSDEKLRGKKVSKGPVNTDALFERFMGIKKK